MIPKCVCRCGRCDPFHPPYLFESLPTVSVCHVSVSPRFGRYLLFYPLPQRKRQTYQTSTQAVLRRVVSFALPTSFPVPLACRRNLAGSQGVQKPHGMALEVVYRAENSCKSSWASAGAFPRAPRGRVPQIADVRSPPPEKPFKKTRLTALDLMCSRFGRPPKRGDVASRTDLRAQLVLSG